jgi:microsomal dipeptidase-like Zn-dependent dipeptidase
MDQIDIVYQLARSYPDEMQVATTAAQVEAAVQSGKLASLMGIEGEVFSLLACVFSFQLELLTSLVL